MKTSNIFQIIIIIIILEFYSVRQRQRLSHINWRLRVGFLNSSVPQFQLKGHSMSRCFVASVNASTIFDMLLSAHWPCRLLHNCVHHCVSFSICVFVFSVRERVPSALTHYIGNFRAMAATERVERAKGHVWLSVSGSVCVYMCVLWHY